MSGQDDQITDQCNHHEAAKSRLRGSLGLGILALVSATFFYSMQDAETKTLVQHYSIWQLVFIRFASFLIVLLGLSLVKGSGVISLLRTKKPALQAIRGTILIAEIALIGLSFQYLGLAEAMTIFHIFPMVGVIVAVLTLGERVSIATIIALVAGFLGVLIVVGPGTNMHPIGVIFALAAAIFYALYLVLTRVTSFVDSTMTSLFFVCLAGVIIPPVVGWGEFSRIAPDHYWDFVRLCAFNMIGQTCIVLAFSMAPSSTLQPLNYIQIVWAAVIGYVIFADVPSVTTWIGGGLIVGAGILQIKAARATAP